jgi:endonuclease/exonuclease/phosphatase family metal-dependent hydrolase
MPLSLATFNVKNLLEPRDEGARSLLQAKLDAVAAMLRACDADVIGLQEIGPPELLRAVLSRLGDSGFTEPILGTADARGIRCALVARVPIVSARVRTAEALAFPAFRTGDPPPFGARIPLRRGVVHARVQAPDLGDVDVFVVHFKSPLPVPLRDVSGAEIEAVSPRERAEGVLRGLVWRCAEALYARGLVDEVLAADPGAQVAVVGDFNDAIDSPAVRAVRGDGEGELLDCTADIPAGARFSVLHRGVPAQIDHALATGNLRARAVAARFLNTDLRDHGDFDPRREDCPTVDSDHAPLVVYFA